jgi:hypothetical protein
MELLASGSGDGTIIIWDVKSGEILKRLKGHSNEVLSVSFSPDGRLLASGSGDKIIIWEGLPKEIYKLRGDISRLEGDVFRLERERDSAIKTLYRPKDEFETTKEYEARLARAREEEARIRKDYAQKIKEIRDKKERLIKDARLNVYPYKTSVVLGSYDADRGGFDAEVEGYKVFIPVDRATAQKIAQNKDRAFVKGDLRIVDLDKFELVNAYLGVEGTNIMVAFGKKTDETLVARAQTAPPALVIETISFEEPSGNKVLDAEETGTIRVLVKNTGKGSAFGVYLNLSGENLPKGINFKEKTYLGEIKSGEERKVEVEVFATEGVLSGEAKFKVQLTEASGFDSKPVILAFNTKALQPPLLEIVKIEIVDTEGKRVIKKGKEINLTISVRNRGDGIAKNVYAVIDVGDSNIKLFSEKEVGLGDIMPGEIKKAIFNISVAQRYSGPKTLPLSFKLKEARERFSVLPDIKLALDEEAPEIKVVKIEAKEVPHTKLISSEDIDNVPQFDKARLAFGEDDVAVVIGIEQYKNVPKSDYSYTDAKLMKAYLLALGFAERNIEFLFDDNATLSAIKKTIERWLPNRVKPHSRVFIYYSGHGAPEPTKGDAYIVPYDGDPNYLDYTAYPLKKLYEELNKLNAKEIIVAFDACFSGAGGRSVLAKGARPLVMMAEAPLLPKNAVILSATQGSQISTSSPEKGHGIFTYYFLKALKEGKKTIAEIYEYIKPLVEDEAKRLNVQQSPNLNPDIERVRGRFTLLR